MFNLSNTYQRTTTSCACYTLAVPSYLEKGIDFSWGRYVHGGYGNGQEGSVQRKTRMWEQLWKGSRQGPSEAAVLKVGAAEHWGKPRLSVTLVLQHVAAPEGWGGIGVPRGLSPSVCCMLPKHSSGECAGFSVNERHYQNVLAAGLSLPSWELFVLGGYWQCLVPRGCSAIKLLSNLRENCGCSCLMILALWHGWMLSVAEVGRDRAVLCL